ncbi:unnamed protein product [Macrosiphum euphorbiae]|uniref:Nuclease HARBI1 n=1 Tax=Macrosiphum euphorbiae TaxID=13131 RepID=A0AAV0Y0W8_9HEMI|nr:unnamed protein product [Macrosiphum euphorbiae]CAI6374579.1 unnamed protein product [Macrosiphum euphorbiae]
MALEDIVHLEVLGMLEEAEIRAVGNRPRQYYNAQNVMEELSDHQFLKKFRLSKALVQELIDVLTPYMIEPNRLSSIPIKIKVLTALRFFASGSYQLDIGDNRSSALSQPSVSRCIAEVSILKF